MEVIWIVEMQHDETNVFEPTVGAALSRTDGREKLKRWKNSNPSDKFRLKKYIRQDKPNE